MPSLRTATKRARALRDIHDEAGAQAYFASMSRAVLPTTGVEVAVPARLV